MHVIFSEPSDDHTPNDFCDALQEVIHSQRVQNNSNISAEVSEDVEIQFVNCDQSDIQILQDSMFLESDDEVQPCMVSETSSVNHLSHPKVTDESVEALNLVQPTISSQNIESALSDGASAVTAISHHAMDTVGETCMRTENEPIILNQSASSISTSHEDSNFASQESVVPVQESSVLSTVPAAMITGKIRRSRKLKAAELTGEGHLESLRNAKKNEQSCKVKNSTKKRKAGADISNQQQVALSMQILNPSPVSPFFYQSFNGQYPPFVINPQNYNPQSNPNAFPMNFLPHYQTHSMCNVPNQMPLTMNSLQPFGQPRQENDQNFPQPSTSSNFQSADLVAQKKHKPKVTVINFK